MTDLPGPAQRAREAFDGEGLWFAPGRVNLIGEHTDYNEGFVLPLALPHGVGISGRRRGDGRITARSLQVDEPLDVSVDDLEPGSVDGWGAYVAGVAWALRQAGQEIQGADLVLDSDVPSGAGLSSSHALECATGTALLGLTGIELHPTELAKIVRTAENDFVGAPTGIMDQMASLHGRVGHVLFLDTRSLEVEPVPFDLGSHDLALLVIDTKAPHALVDGEYAERRRSCEEGARLLGVPALRDVTVEDLDDAMRRIDDDVVARRVKHVVTEDARVLDVVRTLRGGGDPRAIGEHLTASHVSMRDDFEITVPRVDAAVDAALAAGAHGSRMTGGGFGGCCLALVEHGAVDDVTAAVKDAYATQGWDEPATFVAQPSDGARRVG